MALISDLVVRISANTKPFTSAVDSSIKAMTSATNAAQKTVQTISRIDTLTTSNAATELKTISQDLNALEEASRAAVPHIDNAKRSVAMLGAASGLAATAIEVTVGPTNLLAYGLANTAKRCEWLFLTLSAVKATLAPVTWALSSAARGAMILLWPMRMLAKAIALVGRPILSMVLAISAWKFSLKTLGVQLSWLKTLLAALPMKVKLLAGMMVAAGAASSVFGSAGRLVARSLMLLAVPFVALKSPLLAFKLAMISGASAVEMMRTAAQRTIGVVKSLGSATGRLVSGGLSRLGGAVRGALTPLNMLAGAGAASGTIGLVKLAADAETLKLQFKVLTGSAEKAGSIIQQLDKFAAQTPFQKMEIGESARMLLAFGSASENVFNELRVIGDIAAATGQPITELAELYGKAQVQGRLFGEDINQLTGRGIPIIQELAKQFGVSESEVKKLVEQGKVGFPELQKALLAMTAPGARFGGMMQELSQTTAGKFSTLVDEFKLLGTEFGEKLLPYANQLLDWTMSIIPAVDGFANAFSGVVSTASGGLLKVFQAIYDVGTVAGVVVGNIGTLWSGMFEEIPKFAKFAFDWIIQNAGIIAENIGTMFQNMFAKISNFGAQLGEEIAYQLGLSDEIVNVGQAAQKPLKALTELPIPKLGEEVGGVVKDVNAALEANRAARQATGTAEEAVKQQTQLNTMTIAEGTTGSATQDKVGRGGGQTLGGALQKGSAEAYSAIVQNMRGNNEQINATKDVSKTIKNEVGKPLKKLAGNQGKFVESIA